MAPSQYGNPRGISWVRCIEHGEAVKQSSPLESKHVQYLRMVGRSYTSPIGTTKRSPKGAHFVLDLGNAPLEPSGLLLERPFPKRMKRGNLGNGKESAGNRVSWYLTLRQGSTVWCYSQHCIFILPSFIPKSCLHDASTCNSRWTRATISLIWPWCTHDVPRGLMGIQQCIHQQKIISIPAKWE